MHGNGISQRNLFAVFRRIGHKVFKSGVFNFHINHVIPLIYIFDITDISVFYTELLVIFGMDYAISNMELNLVITKLFPEGNGAFRNRIYSILKIIVQRNRSAPGFMYRSKDHDVVQ